MTPRRPYNLYCVGADVKPCSINQFVTTLFLKSISEECCLPTNGFYKEYSASASSYAATLQDMLIARFISSTLLLAHDLVEDGTIASVYKPQELEEDLQRKVGQTSPAAEHLPKTVHP